MQLRNKAAARAVAHKVLRDHRPVAAPAIYVYGRAGQVIGCVACDKWYDEDDFYTHQRDLVIDAIYQSQITAPEATA